MDRYKKYAAAAAAAAIILVAVVAVFPGGPPRVTVDFFSVGQGDAMLAASGERQMLIDGGPDRMVLSRLGRAMPFFDRTIEYVAITHPHADHYSGLAAVAAAYRIRQVLIPAARADSREFSAVLEDLRRSGAEIVELGAGDAVDLGDARFDVLWPPRGAKPPAGLDAGAAANSLSLVMRMSVFCVAAAAVHDRSGCGAVLFSGDATTETEDGIIASGRTVAASVLKVGHHGSNRSTSAAWLRAVRPELGVIEVGPNNYGHPALALLRRLAVAGVRTWRTGQDGGLRAVFTSDGWQAAAR